MSPESVRTRARFVTALFAALLLTRPLAASPPSASTRSTTAAQRARPARPAASRLRRAATPTFAGSRAGLIAGSAEAFATLGARGVPVAVVTNNSSAFARSVVSRFGLASVHYVVGARTPRGRVVRPAKPDPRMLLRAAHELGVAPADMLFVGDSVSDIVAGRAAGMRTVGILGGAASADELNAAHADFVLARFAELPGLVDRLDHAGARPHAIGTDMDGTFLDSYPDYRAALLGALGEIGYPIRGEDLDRRFGGRVFSEREANALVRPADVARLQAAYQRALERVLNGAESVAH